MPRNHTLGVAEWDNPEAVAPDSPVFDVSAFGYEDNMVIDGEKGLVV